MKKSLEPKTCFGHIRSIKTWNQVKFKGYIHSDEAYKSVSEGHGPILLQFTGKFQLVFFKDLSGAQ
jgi:hypothetical protein